MKITEVTTYSVHTTQFRNFNFVRIDTDEGVHGVGELFCIGADKATAEMVKYVSEWVVGMDPLDRERIQKRILNYSRFPGGSILYTAASAIDLALWDIAGKIANLPVYKMVGAVRDRVPVYCHTMGKDSKAALEMLQPKIEKYGYKACKVGVKGLGYFPNGSAEARLVEMFEGMRNALGPDFEIGIDMQSKIYEPREGRRVANLIEPYRPFFVEEPIRPDNLEAWTEMAQGLNVPLATGEQISISLLAMALNELGCHAISLTGWQAGFRTDRAYTKARITRLETERISSELERNRVVVVAGFQGLNKMDDITTLGRGGSDTSAVAIAAALHADRCQIFTDVEGVYTADPRKVRNTRKLDEITFDEMLELASLGAQVLNNRSVELAKKYNVELEVLSSLNPVPGTVVKEVTKDMEGMLIKGVAKDTDVAVITILNVPDEPGMSFKIFGLLAQKNINVDIILQSTGRDGKKDISFTCSEGEADLAMRVLKESAHFNDVSVDTTCAKVSIVGAGMQSHSGVASKMFEALSNNNINIKMISTSEIKISCIINRDDADKAVSAIHDMLFD